MVPKSSGVSRYARTGLLTRRMTCPAPKACSVQREPRTARDLREGLASLPVASEGARVAAATPEASERVSSELSDLPLTPLMNLYSGLASSGQYTAFWFIGDASGAYDGEREQYGLH